MMFISENLRIEMLIVDLREYVEPKELPRMNFKKGDLNRRVRRLEYDYSVEFEGEQPSYFVQFKRPGENTATKLKVHTSRVDLARLETHQSLSRDNQSSLSFSEPNNDDNSSCMLEMSGTILSSDDSSIPVIPTLSTKKEQRASELAVTLLPRTRSGSSRKRISESLIDAFENDMSSSVLFQPNDLEFPELAQDPARNNASQFISSPNPNPPSLQSFQGDSNRLHKPISDTLIFAGTTGEFESGPGSVIAGTENFLASNVVRGQHGALSRVVPKGQSRVPFKAKTPAAPSPTTVPPSRRITRQAISEALATVSPNVRRQKVMFSAVGEKELSTSKAGSRLKDSLLPVPSKKQKCIASTGSKL